MKIVSWNCNGAFRKKFHLLEQFDADVLIIQECENPALSNSIDYIEWAHTYIWVGNTKSRGLGVFAKERLMLSEIKFNQNFGNSCLKWFIPFNYNNQLDFVAVWTQKTFNGEFRYIGQFYKLLINNYEEINNLIFIGDFNSNKIWDYKRLEGDHSSCVRLLEDKGIVILYHEHMGVNQGEESDYTFYLHRNLKKPYHIDYAFLPKDLLENATLSIVLHNDWLAFSDHMPLFINIK